MPIEGVEAKRESWIPAEERARYHTLQQQPCPVACLPCRSKTLLRGAVDFVDRDTTWKYKGNRGNEAIGGDKDDQTPVLHEATDSKGSRSTVTARGIYRLGSGLISFVSAALLVAVSAFGSPTASSEARHGGAHEDRDFDYHIGVDPRKGANDEYMAVGNGERKAAVSEAETHMQEHWLSLRGAASLELQERGDDATEAELRTTSREHLEIASSALGLGEVADLAVDSQSKGISVRMARVRRDLNTLDEGREARERGRELHHFLPGEWASSSNVQRAGVHTVRILQVGPLFTRPDWPRARGTSPTKQPRRLYCCGACLQRVTMRIRMCVFTTPLFSMTTSCPVFPRAGAGFCQ